MAYTTPDNLRLVLPDAGTVADATSDDTALERIIAQAQATVDTYCGRSWPEAGDAAARCFYGNGTPKLRLDWTATTINAAAVALPSGWTEPAFVELRDAATDTLFLQIVDSEGFLIPSVIDYSPWVWAEGLPVDITAAWGYASTPADVAMATEIIATARWRETYAAKLADWRSDVGLAFQIPENARDILDRYRVAESMRVGGLY